MSAHIAKTVERIKNDMVLVIQDTSYIKYTSHKKTIELRVLTRGRADRKETKEPCNAHSTCSEFEWLLSTWNIRSKY